MTRVVLMLLLIVALLEVCICFIVLMDDLERENHVRDKDKISEEHKTD